MSPERGLIELLLVFGAVMAWALWQWWQWWDWRRKRKQPPQDSSSAEDSQRQKPLDQHRNVDDQRKL